MTANSAGPGAPDGRRVPVRGWMAAKPVARVFAALTADGAEARFVGGCVRDALLGRPVNDIDIATPLAPEAVIALADKAGLKSVPTGIDHGTVTLVSGGRPFEVTTLREDVETDGRHAVVAFTDDWQADAARRDFTFNAMSCRPDGTLYDYFDGARDLATGRVRFVGDPGARIDEDVLRLLRFYRMHAWFGRGAPDEAGRAACRAKADRLPSLSAERVRDELLKTLRAPDPVPVIRLMADDGVLTEVLPEATALDRLARLVTETEAAVIAAPGSDGATDAGLRRLAATLRAGADVPSLAKRLRLSKRQGAHLDAVARAAGELDLAGDRAAQRRQLYAMTEPVYRDAVAIAAADGKAGAGAFASAVDALSDWVAITLPVSGADLVARGVPAGPAVGRLIRALERWWVDGDFQAHRDAVLAEADRRLATGSATGNATGNATGKATGEGAG